MKYVVIDTETSGLFDFSKPADAEGQPRLAHLAMIFVDEELGEEKRSEFFIRPDGWTLGEEVTKVHGLTTEYLIEVGLPVSAVIAEYAQAIDDGYVVVAFNAQFDTKIMRGEMRRAEIDDRFDRTPNICVMRALVDICKVPKKTGKGFKFPKLSEACEHFKIVNEAEHSATGDAEACLHLFRKLHVLDALPLPAVHFAKLIPEGKAA